MDSSRTSDWISYRLICIHILIWPVDPNTYIFACWNRIVNKRTINLCLGAVGSLMKVEEVRLLSGEVRERGVLYGHSTAFRTCNDWNETQRTKTPQPHIYKKDNKCIMECGLAVCIALIHNKVELIHIDSR